MEPFINPATDGLRFAKIAYPSEKYLSKTKDDFNKHFDPKPSQFEYQDSFQ